MSGDDRLRDVCGRTARTYPWRLICVSLAVSAVYATSTCYSHLMSDARIRVSRALYGSALADAIDWQESFLDTHDSDLYPGGPSCCKPGARCDGYKDSAQRLRRYRQAFASISAPAPPASPVRTITLAELSARGETAWPA